MRFLADLLDVSVDTIFQRLQEFAESLASPETKASIQEIENHGMQHDQDKKINDDFSFS